MRRVCVCCLVYTRMAFCFCHEPIKSDGKISVCMKYIVLMSSNKDKTAVHVCSSYLHCSYSGETVVRMRGKTVELSVGGLFIFGSTSGHKSLNSNFEIRAR